MSERKKKSLEDIITRDTELMRKLEELAFINNMSVEEVVYNILKQAIEKREEETTLTERDFKNITPEALYSAFKLLNAIESRYIRVLSYVNVSNAVSIIQLIYDIYNRYYQVLQQSQTQTPPPPPLLPPPQPQSQNMLSSLFKAIELFTLGREDVRKTLARDIAIELVNILKPSEAKTETGSQS